MIEYIYIQIILIINLIYIYFIFENEFIILKESNLFKNYLGSTSKLQNFLFSYYSLFGVKKNILCFLRCFNINYFSCSVFYL